jgi:hypothetical protein
VVHNRPIPLCASSIRRLPGDRGRRAAPSPGPMRPPCVSARHHPTAAWRPRSSNNDAATPVPSFVRWPEHSTGRPPSRSTGSCVRHSDLLVSVSPRQRCTSSPQTSPQDAPSTWRDPLGDRCSGHSGDALGFDSWRPTGGSLRRRTRSTRPPQLLARGWDVVEGGRDDVAARAGGWMTGCADGKR